MYREKAEPGNVVSVFSLVNIYTISDGLINK